jgi:hypothetical protein
LAPVSPRQVRDNAHRRNQKVGVRAVIMDHAYLTGYVAPWVRYIAGSVVGDLPTPDIRGGSLCTFGARTDRAGG